MLCGPQPNAWPSVRKRNITESFIFCGEILLESVHVLGGVMSSDRRVLMSFIVPCDILVDRWLTDICSTPDGLCHPCQLSVDALGRASHLKRALVASLWAAELCLCVT